MRSAEWLRSNFCGGGGENSTGPGSAGRLDAVAREPARLADTATPVLLPGERWFAVHSLIHREAGAAIQLQNQGFRTFLPLRPKTWRHAHRIETRLVPLFPGYFFIAFDLDRNRWRSINGTFGVQRLVMAGDGRPTPVPRGIVEALIAEADEQGCLRPSGLLRRGQAVRILAGPFGDRIGELVHLDDGGRIRVLIELLGGQVSVQLSRRQVVAAG